jgi:asparagine synthase (glutamine-hydrolysing)
MCNTLLRDTDFMSMSHGLEVRVPFIDPIVARYVLALPGAWKVGHLSKPLLLAAMRDLVPQEIWRRRKMGFAFPFDSWLRSGLASEVTDLLLGSPSRAGLDRTSVEKVCSAFQQRRTSWSRPWALYVLEKWCRLNQAYV